MPSLWARRLAEDEVVELDVVEPVMAEDVVANCINEADLVEGRMPMPKAISKDGLVVREDRRDDDASADVLLMLSRTSEELPKRCRSQSR